MTIKNTRGNAAKIGFLISIILYVISLNQSAYCTSIGCGEPFEGLLLLLIGALGIPMCSAGLCWFANPLLFISWWYYKRNKKVSFYYSVASSVMALSFIFFKKIVVNEGGALHDITQLQIGYCLWLSSNLLMLCVTIVSLVYRQKQVITKSAYTTNQKAV